MMSERYESLFRFWMDKLRRELPEHLSYHNADHTRNVVNACSFLAEKEGLSKLDKELLLVAALFHDAGFLVRYESNEHVGVRLAGEHLPEMGYTSGEIDTIKGIILSTNPDTKPANLIESIIHDADLNYLGRPDYLKRSNDLRKEMSVMGQSFSDREWLELQTNFLGNFSYYTESAKRLVNSGLDKNRRLVEDQLANI